DRELRHPDIDDDLPRQPERVEPGRDLARCRASTIEAELGTLFQPLSDARELDRRALERLAPFDHVYARPAAGNGPAPDDGAVGHQTDAPEELGGADRAARGGGGGIGHRSSQTGVGASYPGRAYPWF